MNHKTQPCPFCGCSLSAKDESGYYVHPAGQCFLREYEFDDDSIAAWNQRALASRSAGAPEDLIDDVSLALRKAWQLGQTYWQQADSESWTLQAKSNETQRKFDELVDETRAVLAVAPVPVSEPEQPKRSVPALLSVPAPLSEYHEDTGPVVWWTWQDGLWLGEPSWIGTPTDSDWPGYHTHWTYHPEFPLPPVAAPAEHPSERGERPIEPEDIDAVAEAIQRETSVEWLIASRAAVAAIDTLIARGNHASEHGEQDCPHGVDGGACKQCYGEATRGEQGAAKGVCQRCGGTGVVADGEITGAGGVEFENGPVKCVKDCPDCAASAPTLTPERDAFENWWNAKLAAGEASIDIAFHMFVELTADSVQPQAAEPKGLTIEQIEKAALDFVKKPGMQGYVEPGDLIDFARALLAKGE